MANLPEEPQPFDPQALCPMCGFNDTANYPPIFYCYDVNCEDLDGEHLHQSCPTCGFMWPVLPITDEMLADLTKEQEQQMEEEQKMAEERKQLDLEQVRMKVQTPGPVGGPGAGQQPAKKAAAPAKKAAPKP